MTTAQECGKFVSLTNRPPLSPGNTPGTHLCQRLSRSQGHSATGRIMSLKNSNETIGNRPATCRFVAQCLKHYATARGSEKNPGFIKNKPWDFPLESRPCQPCRCQSLVSLLNSTTVYKSCASSRLIFITSITLRQTRAQASTIFFQETKQKRLQKRLIQRITIVGLRSFNGISETGMQ